MAEKETPVDDQLELKKRARRRLVGAVALALAAIVILPMVMDSEPRPTGQDIQVRIPSQDAADSEIPRKTTGGVAAPASIAAAPAAVASGSKPESVAAVVTKPAEAPVESAPKPATPVKPVEKAPEKVVDHSADRLADKAVAKKAEEARAAAALEGKPVAPATNGGPWVVQLGAYQNTGNVKLLMSKLKEMGIASYTEKLESPQGPRTRVRAGPFPSREAADKAQARIRKIGVDGSVAPKQ